MLNNDDDSQKIVDVIHLYFNGTHFGDAEQLKRAFHKDARITGNLNGATHDWSLADFVTRVTTKPTAAEKNEFFDKKIIFIDKTENTAVVKAQVLVAGLTFVDYITLLKINNVWIIRNKSFTA